MNEWTLTEEWLNDKATELEEPSYALLQGYLWTGFAIFRNGKLEYPAKVERTWTEYWDVRLFGPKGEYHCWKDGDGLWNHRFQAAEEWENNHLEREYVMWGTAIKKAGEGDPGGWTCVTEANGAQIWLPLEIEPALRKRPMRLMTWLRIEKDNDGLAYIGDAMLRLIKQTEVDEEA